MLTRGNVFHTLRENGLKQNTHDWKDYEMGKHLLFPNRGVGMYVETGEYEYAIKLLCEYFGV